MFKTVPYKFIPAVATLLCVCSTQPVNFHFGVNFPVGRPAVVRPVYPVYTVPVYPVREIRVVQPSHSPLIHEIKHDFECMHSLLSHSAYCELNSFSREIRNSWSYWARSYESAYGMHRRDLEAIQDEVRDILFDLRRMQSLRITLCPYQYQDLHHALRNLADIISSGRRRSTDVYDVISYLSKIHRILVTA